MNSHVFLKLRVKHKPQTPILKYNVTTEEVSKLVSKCKKADQVEGRYLPPFSPVYVMVYLDSGFKRKAVYLKDLHLKTDGEEITVEGDLKGDDKVIPRDSRLCFQVYVSCLNQCNHVCREDDGAANMDLYSLLESKEPIEIPLSVKTLPRKDVKGHLYLNVLQCTIGAGINFAKNVLPHENNEKNETAVSALISCYMRDWAAENSTFRTVIKSSDQVTCPLIPGQVTFCNSKIGVPFCGYVLFERPDVDHLFWSNSLRIMVNRLSFYDLEDFVAFFYSLPVPQKVGYAGNLVVQYVQQLPYIGDFAFFKPGKGEFSGKVAIEMFGDALAAGCGDCEDLACAINQMLDVFLDTKFDTHHEEGQCLSNMQDLLRPYVYVLAIDGVTSSHVENTKKAEKEERWNESKINGFHAAGKWIPKKYFKECLQRWNPNHAMVKSFEKMEEYSHSRYDELPVVLGEGTGMLECGLREDDLAETREMLYASGAVSVGKKEIIPAEREKSPFYKCVLFGVTNSFIDEHGVGSFRFSENGDSMTRGIPFSKLVTKSKDVVILPYGFKKRCDDCRELTDKHIKFLKSAVKTRTPPPNVEGHEGVVIQDGSEDLPVLKIYRDKFQNAVGHHPLPLSKHSRPKKISLHYSKDQITKELMEELYDHVVKKTSKLKGRFLGMNCVKEMHTKDFGNYRLDFYVSK